MSTTLGSQPALEDRGYGVSVRIIGLREQLTPHRIAGTLQLYQKADGLLYYLASDGTEQTLRSGNLEYLSAAFDVASTGASNFIISPYAGAIVAMKAVNSSINTVAKTILTAEIGGTLVVAPAWEWAINDAADTIISSVPTSARVVAAGGSIEIISDGGGTGVFDAHIQLTIDTSLLA